MPIVSVISRSRLLVAALAAIVGLSGCATKPRKTSVASDSRPSAVAVPAGEEDRGEYSGVAIGQPEWDTRLEKNPFVQQWVEYFQGRGRKYMEIYLARSTRYLELMKGILQENGLPAELVYVPMIESGYSFSAKSKANAVGYWQFIKATGKRYGLRINKLLDDRRDPIYSTNAASQYLKGLYSLFGSWELALAAYNVGENRVQRVLMNNYTRDYWEMARRRLLPAETLNYVPKFVAAALIAKNPAKYGFTDIEYYEPFRFEQMSLTKPVNLRVMASRLGLGYQEFKMYNPAYKGDHAPLGPDRKVVIRIPVSTTGEPAVQAALEQAEVKLPEPVVNYDNPSEKDYIYYRVRRGDNLGRIAKRYGVTQDEIIKINNFSKHNFLKVGKRIKVPTDANERSETQVIRQDVQRTERLPSGSFVSGKNGKSAVAASKMPKANRLPQKKIHVVQKGETLSKIAEAYQVSVRKLSELNRLHMKKHLLAGTRLVIPTLN